jgi:hypothetical protein
MVRVTSLSMHRALGQLMLMVDRHPSLGAEVARARREFFGVETPDVDPLRQAAADARFAEWYLLERESEVLGEVPARSLRHKMTEVPPDYDVLLDSTAGVFLVEDGAAGVQLRDLQDGKAYDIEPEMLELRAGDVLVGRVFHDAPGSGVPSAAVAVQSNARELAAAFRRDVAGLGLDRRLTQAEIEHLLFRRWRLAAHASEAEVSLEAMEADLDRLLRTAGPGAPTAQQISRTLRQAEEPGPVLAELLDRLAFETDVDLERARMLLLGISNAHRSARTAPPAPPAPRGSASAGASETLGARLAQHLEQGLQSRRDVEEMFADLGEMLGEELEGDEEDEGGEPWGSCDQGDLEPLVQEFLWEERCEEGREARVLALLVGQQKEAPVPKLDLEYLETADLMRLLLREYLGAPPALRQARVLEAFDVLRRFYEWAERTQQYELRAVLDACRGALVDELPRLHAASLALSAAAEAPGDEAPALLRVAYAGPEGLEVVPCDGAEPLRVRNPAALDALRAGDLLLAKVHVEAPATAALRDMVVVLPAGAETLLG